MKRTLRDLVKITFPVGKEKKAILAQAAHYLDPEDLAMLTEYVKTDKCFGATQRFTTTVFPEASWPLFRSHLHLPEVDACIAKVNETVAAKAKERAFRLFAEYALDKLPVAIAPHIVGHETVKRAAALQLFATDAFHILLIGDPGTGKTDVLRSLHAVAPVASFGLGSGVSGVGLSAMARGDELLKGLLPLADGGIACIDELNLIKAKDLAALYNAMEKGFITYDKGAKHETLSARVRVCATANPAQHTFVGQTAEVLRKQIPFDDALLSRFHLIFVVRKPSEEEFGEIARKVVSGKHEGISAGDAAFLKEYASFAQDIAVTVPPELEQRIVGFVRELKRDERKFLAEVGPRTAVGVVRLVKAAARAELVETAAEHHLDIAFAIMREALYRGADDA